MTMLNAGEKLIVCEACQHQEVLSIKRSVHLRKCPRCGIVDLVVSKVKPSNVNGIGRNATADLGLALLVDMAGQNYDHDALDNNPENPENENKCDSCQLDPGSFPMCPPGKTASCALWEPKENS